MNWLFIQVLSLDIALGLIFIYVRHILHDQKNANLNYMVFYQFWASEIENSCMSFTNMILNFTKGKYHEFETKIFETSWTHRSIHVS